MSGRNHLKTPHTPYPQDIHDAEDQCGSYAASHPGRFDEEVFQLVAAAGLAPGGETHERPARFRDVGSSLGQPVRPQGQVLRMGQQVVAVSRIGQGRLSRLGASPGLPSSCCVNSKWYCMPGSPSSTPPVAGVPCEAVKLAQSEPFAVEADNRVELIGGTRDAHAPRRRRSGP